VSSHEGRKKDCVTQCALEACRILNAEGVLRQSRSELAKRKQEKDWESQDFYDSDEDQFFDRTGDLEKKRLKRMAKVGKLSQTEMEQALGSSGSSRKVLTFDNILIDIKALVQEQKTIDQKLDTCKDVSKAIAEDDVDAYIRSLKIVGNQIDTITRAKLRRRLVEIKNEIIKLEKLLLKAKPSTFDVAKWKDDLDNDLKREVVTVKRDEEEVKVEKSPENDQEEEKRRLLKSEESVKVSLKRVNAEQIQAQLKLNKSVTEQMSKKDDEDEPMSSSTTSKPKKPKIKQMENKSEVEELVDNKEYASTKDYAVWMPPADQSGDGKTKLNEKFGY
jgi:hypothetical protein